MPRDYFGKADGTHTLFTSNGSTLRPNAHDNELL